MSILGSAGNLRSGEQRGDRCRTDSSLSDRDDTPVNGIAHELGSPNSDPPANLHKTTYRVVPLRWHDACSEGAMKSGDEMSRLSGSQVGKHTTQGPVPLRPLVRV